MRRAASLFLVSMPLHAMREERFAMLQHLASGKESSHHLRQSWHSHRSAAHAAKPCSSALDYGKVLKASSTPRMLAVAYALWGSTLLWLMSSTATFFFVPSLLYWARRLHLRPQLVGATLVAFGNGAPELFSAVTAADDNDLPLAFSELLGGSVFMLTVTGGSVLLIGRHYARSRQETPEPVSTASFKTVSVAYAVAVLLVVMIISKGYVTTMDALSLPLVYILFVSMLARYETGDCRADQDPKIDATDIGWLTFASEQTDSRLHLASWCLRAPWYCLRWLTIPPADGNWSGSIRILCSLAPTGFVVFLIATNWAGPLGSYTYFCVSALAAAGATGVYIFRQSTAVQELPWFYPGIAVLGSLSAALWLDAIATEITGLVEAVGLSVHIPPVCLGATLVSWGNSIGDLMSLSTLAGCGYMQEAFIAVIASPVFDLMSCGFTLAVASSSQRAGKVPLFTGASWPYDVGTSVAVAALGIGVCLLILLMVGLHSTSFTTPLGLYAAYAVFLIAVLFVA